MSVLTCVESVQKQALYPPVASRAGQQSKVACDRHLKHACMQKALCTNDTSSCLAAAGAGVKASGVPPVFQERARGRAGVALVPERAPRDRVQAHVWRQGHLPPGLPPGRQGGRLPAGVACRHADTTGASRVQAVNACKISVYSNPWGTTKILWAQVAIPPSCSLDASLAKEVTFWVQPTANVEQCCQFAVCPARIGGCCLCVPPVYSGRRLPGDANHQLQGRRGAPSACRRLNVPVCTACRRTWCATCTRA